MEFNFNNGPGSPAAEPDATSPATTPESPVAAPAPVSEVPRRTESLASALPQTPRIAREALAAVPMAFREACWNVGATRWQTIWHVVLPNSISGILTGVILQVSRAAGETAPLGPAADRARAEALRAELTQGIDEDVVAFNTLMGAYGLPRGTDEEKAKRTDAIQAALGGHPVLGAAKANLGHLLPASAAVGRSPMVISEAPSPASPITSR